MTSPFLSTREAAAYLGFTSADGAPDCKAVLAFIDRHNAGKPDAEQVRTYTLGRMVRVHRDDLDRLLSRRRVS